MAIGDGADLPTSNFAGHSRSISVVCFQCVLEIDEFQEDSI